jgi:hypothetical protein
MLPARVVPRPRGGALHAAWHRRNVLGAHDRTLTGRVAGVLVTPVIAALTALKRRRGGRDAVPAEGGTTDAGEQDFLLTPSPLREPIG